MICKMQTHYLWLCGLMSKNEQINAWKIFPIWTNLWAIPIKSFLQIDPRRFTQNQQKLVFFFFLHHTWYPPHMQVHPSRYSSSSETFCTNISVLNCSLRSWLRWPPAVYTEVSSFSSFTFTPEKRKFSSFMNFSLELTLANAFFHCNYFLPNEITNNLGMHIFFTFWDTLDLYTFLIKVLKSAF